VCLAISGCEVGGVWWFHSVNVDENPIFDRYYMTTIGESKSADIIAALGPIDEELMSQSEKVVATWTEEDLHGKLYWFNMVSFHEEDMTAARKYCLLVDEDARRGIEGVLTRQEWLYHQNLRFEAEVMLDDEIVNAAYANEDEMRIAVLKEIYAKFTDDAEEVTDDSRVLYSSAMMVKVMLRDLLYELERSPKKAEWLDDLAGLEFDHLTLNRARARMLIDNCNIVKLKVKIGSNIKNFEDHPDVKGM
jgi:hypothetical protein